MSRLTKRQRVRIQSIRDHRKSMAIFDGTFLRLDLRNIRESNPELTDQEALLKALEARFANWWDSWIDPPLAQLLDDDDRAREGEK